MSKLVFKPEMFSKDFNTYGMAQTAQQIFDEWLEKQTVVFGFGAHDGWGWRTDSRNGETKKAYVVCIEEIKECEHEPVTFASQGFGEIDFNLVKCRKCGKQLKPKNGWEEV